MIKKDKLSLRKSALRVLNDAELDHVVGGGGGTSTVVTTVQTLFCPSPPPPPPPAATPGCPSNGCPHTYGCGQSFTCPSGSCNCDGGGDTGGGGGGGTGSGIGSSTCYPIEEE